MRFPMWFQVKEETRVKDYVSRSEMLIKIWPKWWMSSRRWHSKWKDVGVKCCCALFLINSGWHDMHDEKHVDVGSKITGDLSRISKTTIRTKGVTRRRRQLKKTWGGKLYQRLDYLRWSQRTWKGRWSLWRRRRSMLRLSCSVDNRCLSHVHVTPL